MGGPPRSTRENLRVELYDDDQGGRLLVHLDGDPHVYVVPPDRHARFAEDAAGLARGEQPAWAQDAMDLRLIPDIDWPHLKYALVGMWEDGELWGPIGQESAGTRWVNEAGWRARRYIGPIEPG